VYGRKGKTIDFWAAGTNKRRKGSLIFHHSFCAGQGWGTEGEIISQKKKKKKKRKKGRGTQLNLTLGEAENKEIPSRDQ